MACRCNVVRGGAVGPRDQAAKLHRVAAERGVTADRRLAGTVEHGEERALGRQRGEGVGVIDARQRFARARIIRARLDADRALPDCREKFVRAHDLGRVLR